MGQNISKKRKLIIDKYNGEKNIDIFLAKLTPSEIKIITKPSVSKGYEFVASNQCFIVESIKDGLVFCKYLGTIEEGKLVDHEFMGRLISAFGNGSRSPRKVQHVFTYNLSNDTDYLSYEYTNGYSEERWETTYISGDKGYYTVYRNTRNLVEQFKNLRHELNIIKLSTKNIGL